MELVLQTEARSNFKNRASSLKFEETQNVKTESQEFVYSGNDG